MKKCWPSLYLLFLVKSVENVVAILDHFVRVQVLAFAWKVGLAFNVIVRIVGRVNGLGIFGMDLGHEGLRFQSVVGKVLNLLNGRAIEMVIVGRSVGVEASERGIALVAASS